MKRCLSSAGSCIRQWHKLAKIGLLILSTITSDFVSVIVLQRTFLAYILTDKLLVNAVFVYKCCSSVVTAKSYFDMCFQMTVCFRVSHSVLCIMISQHSNEKR